jgi:hypothetical protein
MDHPLQQAGVMADSDALRFLTVRGVLTPDNRLELALGGLTDSPRAPIPAESPLVAEVRDEAGRVLLAQPLAVDTLCADGTPVTVRRVSGAVPFHAATHEIRFVHRGVVIEELSVWHAAPRIELTEQPPDRLEGRHVLRWRAEHPEGRPVWFIVRYTHDGGETWRPLGLRQTEAVFEIDADQLPGGARCRLAVEAHDGIHTAIAESRGFRVPVKPCRAVIISPEDGARLEASQAVALRGQGIWLEEERVEREALEWTSSVDGVLGRGPALDVNLTPGSHRITLTAGDRRRSGTTSITIFLQADEPHGQPPPHDAGPS